MILTRLTWVLLACLCGCSTAAKLSLVTGEYVEAKIQRSDQENLFVETETGAEVPIPRAEITTIDHPGNVVAVIGGALTAYGALNIAVGFKNCEQMKPPVDLPEEPPRGTACVGVFWPATLGASMLTWGLVTWISSTRAASRASSQDIRTVPIPPSPSAFDFSRVPTGGRGKGFRGTR